MALSTGTSQGKRLSSEGLTVEALPVLSGSFIAGCVTAGFFFATMFAPGSGQSSHLSGLTDGVCRALENGSSAEHCMESSRAPLFPQSQYGFLRLWPDESVGDSPLGADQQRRGKYPRPFNSQVGSGVLLK